MSSPKQFAILASMGYTKEEIAQMSEKEAWDIIAKHKSKTNEKILKKDFKKPERPLSEINALNSFLARKDIEKAIYEENNYFDNKEPQLLHDVLHELGYNEKPILIDKETFDEYKRKGAQVIYRGVPINDYERQLRESNDVRYGKGNYVNGLHFSILENEGFIYSKNFDIARAILHPKAKLVKFSNLYSIDKHISMEQDNNLFFQNGASKTRLSIIAASLGYDGIDLENGNYCILNRGVLIMEEDDNES